MVSDRCPLCVREKTLWWYHRGERSPLDIMAWRNVREDIFAGPNSLFGESQNDGQLDKEKAALERRRK